MNCHSWVLQALTWPLNSPDPNPIEQVQFAGVPPWIGLWAADAWIQDLWGCPLVFSTSFSGSFGLQIGASIDNLFQHIHRCLYRLGSLEFWGQVNALSSLLGSSGHSMALFFFSSRDQCPTGQGHCCQELTLMGWTWSAVVFGWVFCVKRHQMNVMHRASPVAHCNCNKMINVIHFTCQCLHWCSCLT